VLNTDGSVTHPLTGTPGGIVSPILANVYLHYTLDLWFQEVVQWHTKGEACLIRYADDFVCGFELQDEAQHFYGALEHRLEKYGLQLAAAKSRVIPFSRNGEPGATRFDFLGFEFSWGKDRAGKPHLKRRTSRKKFRNWLANFTAWCKQSRHVPLGGVPDVEAQAPELLQLLWSSGNSGGLKAFFNEAMGTVEMVEPASQRRSFTRQGFDDCSNTSKCHDHESPQGHESHSGDQRSVLMPDPEASNTKRAVLEKGTPGSVRSSLGHWPSTAMPD
jgi:hypothetical protein